MQQAVTSTQVSLTPGGTSVVISLLTSRQHLVRVKLNQLLELVERYTTTKSSSYGLYFKRRLVELLNRTGAPALVSTSASASITEQQQQLHQPQKSSLSGSDEEIGNMMRGLEQLLKRPDMAPLVAVDPLIEPILIEKNRSFFENKHGFSESELMNCEYREPLTTRERRALLNSINSIGIFSRVTLKFK